ncbi:tripartite tricarboxylate transporter substrate binding protein [Variovorax rhizosphaerae]|uniref:Tripartite tricarboxylate transporter substrate binding protein n=1 Tax=Variovorax rhizosphaerae TaxID=1836200 RepID=A0ABU8WR64_9BURK
MNSFHRRSLLAVAAGAALFASVPALAANDAYPSRPIKVIVPFPAGGTTDTLMRTVAPRLSKALGQPVVIENKSGASATVGADFVAKSAPDGYTVLVGAAHHTIAQAVFTKLPYSFDRDLTPVGMMALVPNVVVVNVAVPAKSVQELVAISKADPDKYNYASAGPGSAHHLIGEMFKLRTGAKLTHIPYRGSAPAVADLLGGQVSVMFDTVTSSLPHIKAQKLRALAVTTAKRSSALPDVPTLAEAGVPNFDVGTWFGLMAPAATPPAIVDRLNREVTTILRDPEVQKQLLSQGIEPMPGTPAELKTRVAKELTEFSTLAKQAKLSVE